MASDVATGVTFQRERAQDSFAEAKALLEAHFSEVPDYPDVVLDPDWDSYAMLDRAGILRSYALRVDGALQGYGLHLVGPSMRYRDFLQAIQDIFYVAPEWRTSAGARFLLWCDAQLAREGVRAVIRTVKVWHDYGALLERFGYTQPEQVWVKRLDGGAHGT